MTILQFPQPSILDTAGKYPTEWWLIYGNTDRPHWWNRYLAQGFQHVSALRRDGRVWLQFSPWGEFLDITVLRNDLTAWQIHPEAWHVQRVVTMREEGELRSKFHLGPITCVEMCKALLGIRSTFVRTPRQLFNYCKRFAS